MNDRDAPRSRPLDELERDAEPELPGVALAAHTLEIEATRPAEEADVTGVPDPALRKRRPWVRWLIGTGLGLAVTGATAWALEGLVTAALADGAWPAWLIVGGIAALVLGFVLAAVREWLALESLDDLRAARLAAARAEETGSDPQAAAKVVARLRRLYRGRPDLEWAWARVDERKAGLDGDALLHLVDREVIAPLDRRAEALAVAAVRRAAAITAVSPFAFMDMAVSTVIVAALLRRMARLYGGRPGWIATLRLLRMSLGAVLASGALDIGDDTIGAALGAGIASKLSRRAGIGILNGLLTARLAVAAMTLIRPFPSRRRPPSARGLALRALTDFGKTEKHDE
ncbi:putative membrane protein [Constrictibacter sp. MBR-5]|jgi:putative membrane protein|uniref:TIGR01620 family protein n=1 Tax=Constrictibacter sp. MBR-5 TaxID=3156467 RepID=UPI00339124B7